MKPIRSGHKFSASHKSITDHGNLYENKHQNAPSHQLPRPETILVLLDNKRREFVEKGFKELLYCIGILPDPAKNENI